MSKNHLLTASVTPPQPLLRLAPDCRYLKDINNSNKLLVGLSLFVSRQLFVYGSNPVVNYGLTSKAGNLPKQSGFYSVYSSSFLSRSIAYLKHSVPNITRPHLQIFSRKWPSPSILYLAFLNATFQCRYDAVFTKLLHINYEC